jgi:putative Mg2+ transporter-C (MgtC) family protein
MSQFFTDLLGDREFLARILLALVLGGLIGVERQAHGRAAGLRTMILVCLGSASIIVAFQKLYLTMQPDAAEVIRMDPARAAAGIITGIGFLGAGTILKSQEFILGLTTAASIWVVAAIGIALGLGEYDIALLLTALVLLTLVGLHQIRIPSHRYAVVRVEGEDDGGLFTRVEVFLARQKLTITDQGLESEPARRNLVMRFVIRFRDPSLMRVVVADLGALPGVRSVRWR